MRKSPLSSDVVIVLKYYLPVVGGRTDRWVNYLRYLTDTQKFRSITVYCADCAEVDLPIDEEINITGVSIKRYKDFSSLPILKFIRIVDNSFLNFVFGITKFRNFITKLEKPIIITSSAPYSVHLFGMFSGEKATWVADFRDPCFRNATNSRLEKLFPIVKYWKFIYERLICIKASKIILNTKFNQIEFENDHPNVKTKTEYAYNGFWGDAIVKCKKQHTKPKFLYYGGIRHDETERGLRSFIEKVKSKYDVDIYSHEDPTISGINWKGFISDKKVENTVLSQNEYIGLLSLSGSENSGWVPQKVYLYAKYNIPILAINPSLELERLIEEYQLGVSLGCDPADVTIQMILDTLDRLQNLERKEVDSLSANANVKRIF